MPNTWTIAVGDDDALFASTLKTWLQHEGHRVEAYYTPEDFIKGVNALKPDAVFLDVVFGGQDGRAICMDLHQRAETRDVAVILMSALRKEVMDMADGLERGADDYLLKPMDRRLVIAKLNSVMQRFRNSSELNPALSRMGLHLDAQSRKVTADGKEIPLTRLEFDLLAYLLRRPGQVLTAQQLLEAVWGYGPEAYNDPATVHVHVSRLRKKLGKAFSECLTTLVNAGYRFDQK